MKIQILFCSWSLSFSNHFNWPEKNGLPQVLKAGSSGISFYRLYGHHDLPNIRDYSSLSSDLTNRTINEMTASESFVHVNFFYESSKYTKNQLIYYK